MQTRSIFIALTLTVLIFSNLAQAQIKTRDAHGNEYLAKILGFATLEFITEPSQKVGEKVPALLASGEIVARIPTADRSMKFDPSKYYNVKSSDKIEVSVRSSPNDEKLLNFSGIIVLPVPGFPEKPAGFFSDSLFCQGAEWNVLNPLTINVKQRNGKLKEVNLDVGLYRIGEYGIPKFRK